MTRVNLYAGVYHLPVYYCHEYLYFFDAINRNCSWVAIQYDEEGKFPHDIMKVLADSDLCGVYIPEEYGGLGGGILEMALVVEELSRACGGISLAFAGTGLGTFPIILFGNDEQKQKYLPDIASGKKLAAFGLTEADAGSDAADATTAAIDGVVCAKRNQAVITNGES